MLIVIYNISHKKRRDKKKIKFVVELRFKQGLAISNLFYSLRGIYNKENISEIST